MPSLALPITRAAILAPRVVAAAPPPTLGTPTFVQVASASAATITNTVPVPTGTTNGELMLAFGTWANTTSTITDPAGWTFIAEYVIDATRRIRAYYRAASSEPASYNWQASPAITSSIVICSYRDCATVSPIDGTPSTATVVSATPSVPGITTGNDRTMLVMAAYAGGTRTYTASALGNERADLGGAGTNSLGVFDGLQATAGASGSKSVTVSSSATVGMMLLGIKPSGGV